MLVLSRRAGEKLYIGNDITITICEIRENSVRLGIDAPKEMNIARYELLKVAYQQCGVDDVVYLGRRPLSEVEAGFIDGSAVIEDAI